MQVTVNGFPADVDEEVTLTDLVSARTDERRRVAVALNGDVVPRSAWNATRLVTGDSIEVLAPVAGG